MPDPGNDPGRGQQSPTEPEPSQKPPHIRDPLPLGDGALLLVGYAVRNRELDPAFGCLLKHGMNIAEHTPGT